MKHLIKTSLICALALSFSTARADYSPTPLADMIMKSHLIVYGTITEVGEKDFTLKIKGQPHGFYHSPTIKVQQFSNWTCAHRWTTYEEGQSVFLFLKKRDGNYFIMSGGGEGEMPIYESNVYVDAFYSYYMVHPIEGKEKATAKWPPKAKKYELYGGTYLGSPFKLDQFADAVSQLRQLYSNPTTPEAIRTYKAKSTLHHWLAQKMEQH